MAINLSAAGGLLLWVAAAAVFSLHRDHSPAVHVVEIRQMKFIPEEITISRGDSVVWINKDIVPHDVTELEEKQWKSDILRNNDRYTTVIEENTTYYCTLHPGMKGIIHILEP